MPIRILPENVASQIAAGEVVERPASVVKELLENCLDAGATSIEIVVEDAGKRLIEVSDNGRGIPRAEMKLAVARHATSKLSSVEDLHRITSLGFRGEALASIGSVSRMTITSRAEGEGEGGRIVVEGGKVGELVSIGAPQGTQVRIRDLFYNVPARLKFLKSDAMERKNIDAYVTRYALANADVRFKLRQDNREVLETSGNSDRREVLASLFEPRLAKQMLEIDASFPESGISVRGFISPTTETRGNRAAITFFVNGRWVQDSALTASLIQAYHTLLMVGRFPIAVAFIEMPQDQLDVNVHPAKSEVRFQNPSELFVTVQRAVKRGLLAYTPVPPIISGKHWPVLDSSPRFVGGLEDQQGAVSAAGQVFGGEQPVTDAASSPSPLLADGMPLLRLIGQIGNSYIVAEGPDGLYLVDQHAAQERVLFEKFMQAIGTGDIPSQRLLSPGIVVLSQESTRLLEEQLPTLLGLGFDVEPFGPNTFQVRSLPDLLVGSDPEAALRALVEDFEEDEAPLASRIEARIVGRVCKRAAVKAGQALSVEEQRALLLGLEGCQAPRTCPHGRPTMIHISLDLLERQFGRRGAI